MRSATKENPETSRITLGLLDAVEQDRSQRRLASASRLLPYYLTPQWLTIVTDVMNAQATCETAFPPLGFKHVLVPELLRVRMREQGGAAK